MGRGIKARAKALAGTRRLCMGPCKRYRPLAAFNKNEYQPGGRQTWCRACHNPVKTATSTTVPYEAKKAALRDDSVLMDRLVELLATYGEPPEV